MLPGHEHSIVVWLYLMVRSVPIEQTSSGMDPVNPENATSRLVSPVSRASSDGMVPTRDGVLVSFSSVRFGSFSPRVVGMVPVNPLLDATCKTCNL